MPAVTGSPGPPIPMRELRELQSQMFDKASAYTKLILGLGYGGFFAAWSGGKANLRPLELMSSAFLMLLSLILFIGFEMYEEFFLSTRNLAFAKALSSQSDVLGAIERLKTDEAKSVNAYVRVWKFIFWPSAITGILGALILIEAFIRSVWRLWK
ncbi:MAG TPA: hypothetical protein VFV92_08060 [Candidatus Bathyarchaeia archaeon]|nr:hypothetical protein [Candidatus Bathyarchaeia archaeon]